MKKLNVMINKQLQTTVDSNKIGDIKQNIPDGTNKSNNWKFAEVTDPIQCRSMKLQDPLSTEKASSRVSSTVNCFIDCELFYNVFACSLTQL